MDASCRVAWDDAAARGARAGLREQARSRGVRSGRGQAWRERQGPLHVGRYGSGGGSSDVDLRPPSGREIRAIITDGPCSYQPCPRGYLPARSFADPALLLDKARVDSLRQSPDEAPGSDVLYEDAVFKGEITDRCQSPAALRPRPGFMLLCGDCRLRDQDPARFGMTGRAGRQGWCQSEAVNRQELLQKED